MNNFKKVMNETTNTQKRWLSPDDLVAEYGFSKSWQAKARMQSNPSSLPFNRIGSKFVKYDRYQIDKWLEAHQVQGIS